jgi:hypothetical protein
MMNNGDSYLGNPRIKRDGVVTNFTKDEVIEYAKCMKDPAYFARKYVKVINLDEGLVPFNLYPYQEEMFDHFNSNRFSIILACRQSGKCVHPDTTIDVNFLDGNARKITVKTLFEIFTSINNYKSKYSGKADYVFSKQVHKDIQFTDVEAQKEFFRFWGNASYNTKKLWWNRLFRKSCDANDARTLPVSSAIDQNVSKNYDGKFFNGERVSYDDSHERRFKGEKLEDVSRVAHRVGQTVIRKNVWGWESLLWENSQGAPERVSWKNPNARTERPNIKLAEATVGGRRVSGNDVETIHCRSTGTNVGLVNRPNSVGRSQTKDKDRDECARSQGTFIRTKTWTDSFGRSQTKDIGIACWAGDGGRTQTKNIGIIDRPNSFGRTQTESFRSGKEPAETDIDLPALSKIRKGTNDVSVSFQQLQNTEKFIESYEGFGFDILSDTGYEELYQVHKTVKFEQFKLKTSDNHELICADNHLVFDEFGNETFVKNLSIGQKIRTDAGFSIVESVTNLNNPIHMYDVGVNHDNHRFYSNGILSHNSISSCAYLLWYALFHSEKTIAILANKGSTAKEMLARITLMLENIPFFLQPGCKALNKGNVDFSNNSRIIASATSGSSIRGLSISLLFLDEFAFVDNDVQFYTSTYPVISSGKTSRVIITSTANGIGNTFHKLWEGAVQNTNEYKPFRVDWWDVPGRDEKWKKQTIANTSEIQFNQEFGNTFVGTGTTLISGDKLLQLRASLPEYTQGSINVYEKPKEDHNYMCFVDVAKGRGMDYSTFNIIDVSAQPFKQVAVYRDNLISPLLLPDIIYKYAKVYNNAYVVIESNDQGVIVCNGLYYELEYENVFVESAVKANSIGVTMTRKVKRVGCSNLKDLIEEDKLELTDQQTIIELSTFEANGSSYEASKGNHDDLVMNLVLFAWFTTNPFFMELTDINIKSMIHSENVRMIEDQLVPFGFIDSGIEENSFQEEIVWDGSVGSSSWSKY